ncbi:MAG: hypothetical protein ACTSPW_20150 [Promethearchaeota archaeon]
MIEVYEFNNQQIRLKPYQKKELDSFRFFSMTRKNLNNPEIKLILKKDFMKFKLYNKHTIYKQLGKSLVAYVN